MTATCLIVRGGWSGHDPVGQTDAMRPHLERRGFALDVEDSPEVYADATRMATYDLVVQAVTNGAITDAQSAGLRAAVEGGAGLAGWHGGLIAAYRGQLDYLQMLGAQFVAHPASRATPDEPQYRRYRVTPTPLGAAHPITAGVAEFEVVTEQYWVLADGLNNVLATSTLAPEEGDAWHGPATMPAVWTRRWGAGRIFVHTLGHDLTTLRRPEVETVVLRGMEWAARQARP
ncbi:ThuA domain-containing protein [Demequina sp. NBRC 110051]|uniref:ThuA domain-containing protein n=1 Tax=Demequina sp. NBRC 110051 TaxID=1570340 RepID=UPI000A05C411|nr:ThuA domain-containing protein [Demequina sp. NBRC 110051]